jgi:hypothetical protein
LPPHIARWDLDKTYLRTDFDTVRDLVRTALERPDEKRTNPGASTLLREMVRAGIRVHILSGSPEQMRRRLEDKLRLDGIAWDSFTLKPNLQNVLRFRFRAVKDQLGYKLPALLRARSVVEVGRDDSEVDLAAVAAGKTRAALASETLFGDDAEADAFVYSLYADVVAAKVSREMLVEVCERGKVYPDVLADLLENLRAIEPHDIVERILIHLERQTSPEELRVYGSRVVPFYNYLQAAFVVFEDARIPADAVLRVAVELIVQHRFDGDALARSYVDLARRGHLRGTRIGALSDAFESWDKREKIPGARELREMLARLPAHSEAARVTWREDQPEIDYVKLVHVHNARRRR